MTLGQRAPVVTGVCPVLETPFSDAGEVDTQGFGKVVNHVASCGVTSVMFPGFASEFHKLADTERDALIEVLVRRVAGTSVTAVISVPDHATHLAVARARRAVELGAQAVNVLPPHFLGPAPAAVRAHLAAVLAAIAPVAVIVQYSPAQTGTAMSAQVLAELAAQHPNLRQVKVESQPPGELISALKQQAPQLSTVIGYAGLQLPDALRRGVVGVQPGCSFVELYLEIWRRWTNGNIPGAEALHTRALPYLAYWMQSVELIVAAEKMISQRRGLIKSAHCRTPAHCLDRQELAMIDRFLTDFDDLLAP